MSTNLTGILQRVYTEFDTPADTIATEPDLREEFADEVRERVRKPGLSTSKILRELLRARKRGSLPRIRRFA